jgi:hypothetical protein
VQREDAENTAVSADYCGVIEPGQIEAMASFTKARSCRELTNVNVSQYCGRTSANTHWQVLCGLSVVPIETFTPLIGPLTIRWKMHFSVASKNKKFSGR